MGKHTRPGTPERECCYGLHYGASEKRGNAWFCDKCGGCTGVSSTATMTGTTTNTATATTLYIPPTPPGGWV